MVQSTYDFKPELFSSFMEQQGQSIILQRVMSCYCMSESGQPDPNHALCKGSGYFYPVSLTTKAFAVSLPEMKTLQQTGQLVTGTVSVTMEAKDFPAWRDRIVFPDALIGFGEVRLVEGPVTSFRFPVVEVVLIMSAGKEYSIDVDFVITDGAIHWVLQPAVGTVVSCSYKMNPSYLIINRPHAIRTAMVSRAPIAMPMQVMAQLEFMVSNVAEI